GSCTILYCLLPGTEPVEVSSAFNCITAWAVVAEPEKKSRMMSLELVDLSINNFTNSIGLGFSKVSFFLNRFVSTLVPSPVFAISYNILLSLYTLTWLSKYSFSYGIHLFPFCSQ